jgi:hypothetical protein
VGGLTTPQLSQARYGEPTETCRGLSVPGAMEGHVHVRGVGVEGVPDGGTMSLERQARGDGLGIAAGIVEGAVWAEDEVTPCLEGTVVGEGGRIPHSEASRVAVPRIPCLQRIAN